MSAEVFYRAMGLEGYWVVDVWGISRRGDRGVGAAAAGIVAVSGVPQSGRACS